MIREICFDTETTGLKPEDGHRLVEIGCIEIIDGDRTTNYFHEYLNPERDVPQDVVAVHGLTQEWLADKPLFKDIVDKFLDYIGDSILVAHNASFDMKFVNNELKLLGKDPLKNEVIDSLVLAKQKFPGQKNNLDALCKRFEIDSSKRVLHGALLDAELLADVYLELKGGAQKSFADNTNQKTTEKTSIPLTELLETISTNKVLKSRNFALTTEELEEHKKFIEEKLKTNLWYNQ